MKWLFLVALMVLVSLVLVVGFSRAADKEIQTFITQVRNVQMAIQELAATVNTGVPAKAKMYYLTATGFTGGYAIMACDSGFHMASISEIQDTSNLHYANRSPTAYDSLVDDPGLDPPSNQKGWIRSGVYPPSGFVYDCDHFANEHNVQLGTTVALQSFSVNAGPGQLVSHPNRWRATLNPCPQPEPVWCVEDPE